MRSFIVYILMVVLFVNNAISAYSYDHDNQDLSQRIWMKDLPNYRKLNKISMPGTHDTCSLHGGDITQTQSLTLKQQLKAGIRFIDIRVEHENNKFQIYHGIIYQQLDFDTLLKDATTFLRENPTETLLMRLTDQRNGKNNTRDFEDTLMDYIKQDEKYFFKANGNYQPLLCNTRGKIVVFRTETITEKLSPWALNYYQAFIVQDAYNLTTNWDLYSKWEKVKAQIEAAFNNSSSDNMFYLNYLSGSGGSFPYFVASGHSSPGNDAPLLSTGLTTPGFKDSYPDFPRINCFIGICTIAFNGTNYLTQEYIDKNIDRFKGGYIGIILADFPGPELIRAVIDVNPKGLSTALGDNQAEECQP